MLKVSIIPHRLVQYPLYTYFRSKCCGLLWFAATEEMMVISRQFMSYNHMTQDISANHNVK